MPLRPERRRGALPTLLSIVKYKQAKCKLKKSLDPNFPEDHGKPSCKQANTQYSMCSLPFDPLRFTPFPHGLGESLSCTGQTDYGSRGGSWESRRTFMGESPGITFMLRRTVAHSLDL